MVGLTAVNAADAVGMLIGALPAPWGKLLGGFASQAAVTGREQRVRIGDHERFLQLYRSRLEAAPHAGEHLASHLAGGQVILVEDLTDSKLLQAQLAHQDRLASVGRLAAGVAHEIGNPLTGIACIAQNLPFDMDPAVVEERAGLIVEQTRRIDRIVRSLVSFSHAGAEALPLQASLAVAPFEVRSAVEDAMSLVRLSRKARGVECTNLCSAGQLVEGDRHKLTQVFVNLLTNACDASKAGAKVEVSVRPDGSWLRIDVSDTGEGIPESIRDRIFDPFFTTKLPGEGTGLGLSLVYSIVREHHGSVEVTSADGAGTTLTVVLPRVAS